jgi:hypothetical protein
MLLLGESLGVVNQGFQFVFFLGYKKEDDALRPIKLQLIKKNITPTVTILINIAEIN